KVSRCGKFRTRVMRWDWRRIRGNMRSASRSSSMRICRQQPSFKQQRLLRPVSPELIGRELRPLCAEAGLFAAHLEHCADLRGKGAFAVHARAEVWVVEFSASDRADAIEDFVFTIGEMTRQPLLEQRRDGMRKPQRNETGAHGAGVGGAAQD